MHLFKDIPRVTVKHVDSELLNTYLKHPQAAGICIYIYIPSTLQTVTICITAILALDLYLLGGNIRQNHFCFIDHMSRTWVCLKMNCAGIASP